jgi:hypothetical protein
MSSRERFDTCYHLASLCLRGVGTGPTLAENAGMLRSLALFTTTAACNASLVTPPPPTFEPDIASFAVLYTHTAALGLDGSLVFTGSTPAPDMVELGVPPAFEIALGRRHACVIADEGSVHCWGEQVNNALGEHRPCLPPETEGGFPECTLVAGIMPSLPPAHDLAAGDDVTCAILDETDQVVCWGASALTAGSVLPAFDPPTPVMAGGQPLTAARLIIEHRTVCAIDLDASLWCWGDGFGSQPAKQPQVGVVDVAFGRRHSCIIDADGLRCSGDNRNGQLGDLAHARSCDDDRECVLEQHAIDLDALRVAVGERHTCVIVRGGDVVCFGSNEVGQLNRDDAFLTGDIGLAIEGGAIEIDAGYSHTCVLRGEGLSCWGSREQLDPREGVVL